MSTITTITKSAALSLATVAAAAPAWAHPGEHALSGAQAFISHIAHSPFHLAAIALAIVAAGLIARAARRRTVKNRTRS